MGILNGLLGKKKEAAPAIEDEPAADCPHGSLGPHWDSTADFGKRDRIAFYICEACGAKFGREEGEASITRTNETVRVDMSVRKSARDAADAARTAKVP